MAQNNRLPHINDLAEMKPGPRTRLIRSLDEAPTKHYLQDIEALRAGGEEIGKGLLVTKDSLSAHMGYLNKVAIPGEQQTLENLLSLAHKDVKAIIYGRVNDQNGMDEPNGLSLGKTNDLLAQVNAQEKAARENIKAVKQQDPQNKGAIQEASRELFKLKSLGQFLGGHANYIAAQDKDPLEMTLKDVLHLRKEPFEQKLEALQNHPAGDAKIELLLMEASMWAHAGAGDGRHTRMVHELACAYALNDPARDVGKTLFDLENTSRGIRAATIELLPESAVDQLLGLAIDRERRMDTSRGEQEVQKDLSQRKLSGIQLDDLLKWKPEQVAGYINHYGFMEVNELLEQAQTAGVEDGHALLDLIESRKSAIATPETQAEIGLLKDKQFGQFRGMDLQAVAEKLETLSDAEKAHLGAVAEEVREVGVAPRGFDHAVLDLFIEARAAMTEDHQVTELAEEPAPETQADRQPTHKPAQTQGAIPGTEELGSGYNRDTAKEIATLIPTSELEALKPILDDINPDGLAMIREELGTIDRSSHTAEMAGNVAGAIVHIDERLADIARETKLEQEAMAAVGR